MPTVGKWSNVDGSWFGGMVWTTGQVRYLYGSATPIAAIPAELLPDAPPVGSAVWIQRDAAGTITHLKIGSFVPGGTPKAGDFDAAAVFAPYESQWARGLPPADWTWGPVHWW